MDVVVKGRHCEISDSFRDHVEEKLSRLEKHDHRVIRLEVEAAMGPCRRAKARRFYKAACGLWVRSRLVASGKSSCYQAPGFHGAFRTKRPMACFPKAFQAFGCRGPRERSRNHKLIRTDPTLGRRFQDDGSRRALRTGAF